MSPPLQDIGLTMTGNEVKISHILSKHLLLLEFPIKGKVMIEGSRTSCDGFTGSCAAAVDFSLEFVQYEVPCPNNLLRFTASQHATVEWTAPIVRKFSGQSLSLSGSYNPGANMTLGTTLVLYGLQMHTSQIPATHITCQFKV